MAFYYYKRSAASRNEHASDAQAASRHRGFKGRSGARGRRRECCSPHREDRRRQNLCIRCGGRRPNPHRGIRL